MLQYLLTRVQPAQVVKPARTLDSPFVKEVAVLLLILCFPQLAYGSRVYCAVWLRMAYRSVVMWQMRDNSW